MLLLVVNIMNTKNLKKFNKKRQFENETINKLCIDVINLLELQYVNQLNTKGRVLTKFLISCINLIFKEIEIFLIFYYKNRYYNEFSLNVRILNKS